MLIEPPQTAAAELSGIAADLARAGVNMEHAADLSQAIAILASDASPPPELLLLPESRPGIWTDRELNALRAVAPLARVLRISGSWCDGQIRSARPPAGSLGMAWHQALSRLSRGLGATTAGGLLPAPLTATSEDLLLGSTCRATSQTTRRCGRPRIAIHAPRTAQAEAWAALCEGLGYRAEIMIRGAAHHDGPADAVLWDCDPRDLADAASVADFVERAGTARVVAVCGFPRPDDVQSALRQGIAVVLAKPLLAADFEWHVSRLFDARDER